MNFSNNKKEAGDFGFMIQEGDPNQIGIGIRDLLAPSAIHVKHGHIELGKRIARSFSIVAYPRFLTEEWLSPIINISREFDIALFIHPVLTKDALRKLRRKVAQVEGQIIERESKGVVRDPKLDTSYSDIEDLRSRLQQGTSRLFNVGVYITIYGNDIKDVNDAEKDMRSLLEGRLIFVKPAMFQQEQGFRSTNPIGNDMLNIHTPFDSGPLSSFFPFVSYDISQEHGIMYGVNKHNASLVLFDRFSLNNYNSVTFAASGAGKSYATKLEIIRLLMMGTDVIVIDPEHEFDKLAAATDGRFFDVSLSSKSHINPFDLPPVGEDEIPADILRVAVINLIGLFKILLKELTQEEESIIDKAIRETYALKDISPSSDFTNMEPPLMSDFVLVLGGIDGGEDIAERLSRYTEGTWSGFVNNPTNIDINRHLVVFSIRDMEQELKPAAMYIITNYIWSNIRKKLKQRLLVVDEAWIMMEDDNTARFLFGLVKRGRKYYLGVSVITQDVNDFLKSDYGKGILNNASLKLLLRQATTSIETIQRVFHLTESEKYFLLEAQKGEGLFIAGLKRVGIQIIASSVEDKIITSDPRQILEQQKES